MSIPYISWQEFVLWVLRRRRRVTVVNRSMLPTLQPGDEILFQPDHDQRLFLNQGDIVITTHPCAPEEQLVKRIFQVHSSHQFDVRGDNGPESTDSRQFGLVPRSRIQGKVTCLFSARRS